MEAVLHAPRGLLGAGADAGELRQSLMAAPTPAVAAAADELQRQQALGRIRERLDKPGAPPPAGAGADAGEQRPGRCLWPCLWCLSLLELLLGVCMSVYGVIVVAVWKCPQLDSWYWRAGLSVGPTILLAAWVGACGLCTRNAGRRRHLLLASAVTTALAGPAEVALAVLMVTRHRQIVGIIVSHKCDVHEDGASPGQIATTYQNWSVITICVLFGLAAAHALKLVLVTAKVLVHRRDDGAATAAAAAAAAAARTAGSGVAFDRPPHSDSFPASMSAHSDVQDAQKPDALAPLTGIQGPAAGSRGAFNRPVLAAGGGDASADASEALLRAQLRAAAGADAGAGTGASVGAAAGGGGGGGGGGGSAAVEQNYQAGRARKKAGDWQGAAVAFSAAIGSGQPWRDAELLGRAHNMRGQCWEKLAQWGEALADYDAAIGHLGAVGTLYANRGQGRRRGSPLAPLSTFRSKFLWLMHFLLLLRLQLLPRLAKLARQGRTTNVQSNSGLTVLQCGSSCCLLRRRTLQPSQPFRL
eukprot:SAG22_NODE_164_length_16817_cov_61.573573_19_plen_528_part_00